VDACDSVLSLPKYSAISSVEFSDYSTKDG
jgi:hypothetical protein